MKIKTFILTFLMMMSSPFLFGQHWVDPDFGTENTMPLSATITLDDVLQTEAYQVAAFHGNTLLEVQSIITIEIPEQGGGGILYHVDMGIPYVDAKTEDIYFKLFNGTNEFVSSTKIDWNENGYLHTNPLKINFKSVAQIENVVYPTLPEAVAAAQADETVTLLDNATGAGVVINKDVTIDFGGFTYSFNEGVGSGSLTSNGFQILKNNNVTLKNGTLNVNQDDASEFYTIIQNYANLTVDGMTLDGTNLDKWSKVEGDGESKVLSINSGTVNITGATSITANDEGDKAFAFDVYDYTSANYPVPTVNVNTTGTIDGKILVSESIPNNLNISAGTFSVEIEEAWCAQGFIPSQIANDKWTVKKGEYVAELNGKKYETFDEAYNAAKNGDVITLFRTVVLDNSKMWWNYSTKNITVKAEFGDVAFRVQSGNNTVWFGNMTIDSDDYCIIVGSSDSSIEANVDIYGGTYKGATTAISVTKGSVNIMDGTFQVEPYQGSYEYTINCFDANYKNGTAKVSIKGGKFYNFNPQNNAAEGAGTDFLTAKYAAVQDAEGYWNVVSAVAMIDVENNTDDKYFATLPEAFAAAEPGQTVTLLKDAAGAGLKINKNVTIDFGGKTYTINQAVGSKGTESQGFQILKEATEVTLKNGNVAVAEKETNVVWMINDYSAKLNVTDLTFDCTNMNWDKTPNVYFLVANNQHGTDPAVTLNNVTVNNFAEGSSPYFMEANTTLASADANLNIDVDPGYRVVYEEGVYSVEKLVAYFKNGAYARFVQDKNREHFSLSVYDVYAKNSLVVKVYHNETLLVTTTLREYDLDDETKKFYPYTSGPKGITVNNVVNLDEEGCKPAGSWLNEWAVAPTVENVPNRYEVWVDGVLNGELDLTESEFDGFSSKENLQTYLGFKSVYKQASITRGEDVTYYMTFDEALAASQANDVITVLDPVVVTEDKAYDFTDRTIKGENVYPVFRIQDGATVTVEGGEVTNPTDYVFVLGDSEQTTSGYLTIKNGTFQGETTVASVTKGNLTIEGGDFSLVEGTTDYRYLINCIDANYTNGTATVAIEGGTFHNWNPQNNAAEGTGTNFCAQGYAATEYPANVWTVLPAVAQINETLYATLQDAINKVADSQTIKLLSNCDENVTIVQTEGLSFTIDGQIAEDVKAEYTGTFQIDGNGGYDRQETLTIKNITFNNVSSTALTYIDAKTKTQSHNVTVEGCDFGGNGNKNAKAISVIEGNNWNVIGCTVNENYNIFVDYAGAYNKIMNKNLLVDDCEINANQGVLLGRFSTGCTIANSTFTNNTYGINVAGRVETKEGEVLSHTLKNVVFNGEAITANYPPATPYHTHIFNVEGYVQSAVSESFPDEIADHSDYLNFVLTTTESTLQAKGQDYLNVSISEELAAQGYEAVYEGDTYVVREIQNVKNVTTGNTYPTLAKAIEAASANDELLLLANVTEDVTINKNLTINGDGKEYTGVMSGNAGLTITVNNVKFIEGRFAKDTKSSTGNYTFKNCTFTGNPNLPYALLFKGANTVTVQDCTVKDYQYSFLYVTSGTTTVNVKDVVVENCPNYAVYFASGVNNNMIENLTVKNSNNGIVYNNTASRTLNLKGCTFENVTTIINNADGTTNITSNFYGENNISNKSFSQYVKVVLKEAGAKLVNAQEGLTVTTTVEGCEVEYEEGETAGFGTYSVIAANVALYRGEDLVKKFATIQDAIDAAQNGDEIVVLKDLTFDDDDVISIDGIKTIISVKEKEITLNNECNISVSYTGDPFLHCVVYVADNSGLTLTGNGTIDVTGVAGTINPSNGKYDYNIAYIFFKKGTTGYLTIDGGNFTAPDLEDSMIYSHGSRLVTVNGGKFTLVNVGTQENGCPWIFNVQGSNEGAVVVNGGTYNDNVFDQYYTFEVQTTKEYAIKYDGDEAGTWTVVPAVAWVNNRIKTDKYYTYELGYVTLAEAFAAAADCNEPDFTETVTLLQNIELAESITINAGEEVILDLNGMNINVANDQVNFNIDGKLTLEDALGTGVFTSRNHMVNAGGEFIVNAGTVQNIETLNLGFPIYLNGGTVTINGGTVQAVNQDNYAIGGTGGTLTINGGTVKGNWGAVNMASGSATIKGGTLEVTGTKGGHALYVAGDAQVTIENGEFKPYNGSNVASYALVLDSENATVNVSGGMFHKEWGCVYVTAGSLSLTGGTFEQDVNAYCAEGFVAVKNGDSRWTVMPCQEQSLVAGWNWYSSYLNITSDDLTEALGDNATQIKGQTQNDGYMQNGGEGFGWSGNLDLDFAKMYMINATQACDIKLAANVLNPEDYTVVLHSDWNWIGYPSNQEVAINDALANIPEPIEGDVIKTRNSGHAEYAWGMWIGTLKTMIPGEGYMYRNTAGTEKQFVYNVEATTRGTVEANYTTENNHWVPNVSEYPFNMTITAVVDGMTNGNYEVAAFVNGEVRGSARPIYVEAIDSYMLFLTINGEDVEEMSFRLYDIDTDTEYDLNNRINYSNNAHLGSVNEPYTFTRGTTGIGEAAMSNINIYPNPTTIGTEINLEATCDKVEVFNALGVKVVEYQNVDSIDALETAGIYVIRITNNGNVQNCRLVVK